MKLSWLLPLFAVGCMTAQGEKLKDEPIKMNETQFMDPRMVVQEIDRAEKGLMFMDGEETQADRERLSNLIPMKVFIPESAKPKKNLFKKEIKGSFDGVPDLVDLRKWDTPIKRQWNGTCTTFAGVAAMEQKLKRPLELDLSERDSWNTYRAYSCAAFVKALSKRRICEEKDWPQAQEKMPSACFNSRDTGLIETRWLENNKYEAVKSLARGNPVYIGMATPSDMVKCHAVIRSKAKERSGGHALLVSGYKLDKSVYGGGYYILKNSWGAQCGDKGYQYLPFGYCDDYDRTWCQMWEVTHVDSLKYDPRPNPMPNNPDKPECPKCEKCKECPEVKPCPDNKPVEPSPKKKKCEGWLWWKKCEYEY